MSDMLGPAWTVFIAVLVIANIVGCLWLIWWTARPRVGEEAEGAEKNHVWDGDLKELNNPMPRWWLNLFVITVVFALSYLVFFPGLGSFTGTLGWSQGDQHDQRLAEVVAKRDAFYARFDGHEVVELAQDLEAVQAASRLFADNCAGCHGPSAQGALGFPNLADDDWLYGHSPAQIITSIAQGRQGAMPAFLATLDPAVASDLITLVSDWNNPPLPEARKSAALQKFKVSCAACHGQDAKGNPLMGAPNLTDDIWLHGGSLEQIRHTVMFGRQGAMPAHKDRLSETEMRLLAAYVYRVSGQADQ